MKKYIFILIAALSMFTAAQAQRVNLPVKAALSATYGLAIDTVTSTAAHYMVSTALPPTLKVTAVATFTEITGTTSGTATIEGSLDGTNWHPLLVNGTTTAQPAYTVTDTATQVTSWDLLYCTDKYIRVKVVGGGTTQYTVAVKYTGISRQ